MATVTDLLVSWPGGWHHEALDDAPIGMEQTIGFTANTLAEIRRLSRAELATYGTGEEEITVRTDPGLTGPKAGYDYRVGQEVLVDGVLRVVEAIAVERSDETGRLRRVPKFGTIFDTPARRAQRVAERHQIGALNGTSKLATPVASIPGREVDPSGGGGVG